MTRESGIGSQALSEDLKTILEFYKELGFERLPLAHSYEDTNEENQSLNKLATDNSSVVTSDKDLSVVTRHSLPNKEAALKALREEIGDCRICKLSSGRTHIVFGEGNADARVMFIGEAPGREDDLQARPFVGEAGQVLTRLIEKMGFQREDVYIANVIKCRPPLNRDPHEDEIASCFKFLAMQIEIVSPDVIMSLGKISGHTLLMVNAPLSKFFISKIRGSFYDYKGIPVMPTFHPAYLLRNPKDKWLTWGDALAVLKKLGVKR